MQTSPVIPGYYANTRQMLLKLSRRNLTKMKTTIKNKSLHYYFTMITVQKTLSWGAHVLNYACSSLLLVIFSHVLRKKLQITLNNRIFECPRWWLPPLSPTSDLPQKVTWPTSAFLNNPPLPHHPTHPNISRKSAAAKENGQSSSALPPSS